jgi:hypothetical protein
VKASFRQQNWQASGYYEFDFLDPNRQNAFRTRQAWVEVSHEQWSLLAGRAWSLLRPSRHGLDSDRGMMNTDVIEPAYHVGLVGGRREQIRLTRRGDNWGTALAFERRSERTGGDVTWKIMRENKLLHVEALALAGGGGRRAFSFAAVVPLTSSIRFVTQEFVARRAAAEALSLVPVAASGASFIEGVEVNVTKTLELYSYGGLVYGTRSEGNRLCREWSVGAARRTTVPGNYGSFVTGVQFSHVNREMWRGGQGSLNYVQVMFRYNLW